jgi:sugar lactone lactonase YvrE
MPLLTAAFGSLGRALALLGLPLLWACQAAEGARAARRIHVIDGFAGPESVRYDPDQDLYFVSNIVGYGSVRDGQGYIARIAAGDLGRVDIFIQSGVGGVVLHAPKGMALQGDTLWVADIDFLRAFDRRTGVPLASLDMRAHGAVMLNDIAVGPDGALYVTDSGIVMSPVGVVYPGGDRIFSIAGPDHAVSVLAEGAGLGHPNGITWDRRNGRWVVVGFHPFHSEVYSVAAGEATREVIATGKGRFDGVEVLDDGRILVTAWSDSSLHVFADGEDRRVITGIWQPADLGVDTRRGVVAIPLVLQGRVEVWELPER